MEDSKITYSAKLAEIEKYEDLDEIYGGTYTRNNPIEIDIQIWNNKYGTTEVKALNNFALNIYFDKYEDASLLNFLTIIYNDIEELSLNHGDGYVVANFLNTVSISGLPNNGSETNKDNYIKLKLIFNVNNDNIELKTKDLKTINLEIVEQ